MCSQIWTKQLSEDPVKVEVPVQQGAELLSEHLPDLTSLNEGELTSLDSRLTRTLRLMVVGCRALFFQALLHYKNQVRQYIINLLSDNILIIMIINLFPLIL